MQLSPEEEEELQREEEAEDSALPADDDAQDNGSNTDGDRWTITHFFMCITNFMHHTTNALF